MAGSLIWTLPPLAAALACGIGMDSRGKPAVTPTIVVALVVWSAIAGLMWLPEREPEATDARVREGIAIAVVFLGALPTIVYYALGRWLGGNQRRVLLVAVISAVPGFFYLFFAILTVADRVSCAPGAYECPL